MRACLTVVAALFALLIAGCGGGDSAGKSSTPSGPPVVQDSSTPGASTSADEQPAQDASSLGFSFPLPEADGALDQNMNEAAIAAMLWDLYDDVSEDDVDSVALGDAALTVMAHERLRTETIDRGGQNPDLVDYLDAHVCAGRPIAELSPALLGFPWVGPELCP